MTEELNYESYNEKFIICHGNKKKYNRLLTRLEGEYHEKLDGWLLEKDKEKLLKSLIKIFKNNKFYEELNKNSKSRKEQKKYYREVSDDDNSSPDIKEKPTLFLNKKELLGSESEDSFSDSSEDSNFPMVNSPRNYEKEIEENKKMVKQRERFFK